jgi:hypothetical protein
VRQEWVRKAPPGTHFAVATNGSMEKAIFKDYIHQFIDNLPSNVQTSSPTLRLLDNHTSHASAEALQLAQDHNIVVFGGLSNATDFLQPCDRFVFAN